MTKTETAELLTLISAYDRRTIGEADVRAWHELVCDVPFADARAAVLHHFATNTDHQNYFVPAHVIAFAKRRRLERIDAFGAAAQMPAADRIARLVDPQDGPVRMEDRKLLLALVAEGTVTADMTERQIAAAVSTYRPKEIQGGGRGE